jgi:CBS domain-containing protein
LSIEDLQSALARILTDPPGTADEKLREEFLQACRLVDHDPREQRRLDDIADLLDADETLYAQALDAVSRGDKHAAEPLLRQCAEAGAGEAAWLLAQLLEDIGNASEAMIWYQRALDDGDVRAAEKLAAFGAQPCQYASIVDKPQKGLAAPADRCTFPILVVGRDGLGGVGHLSIPGRRLDHALISAAELAEPTSGIDGLWVITDPGSDHHASLDDMWHAVGEDRAYAVQCKTLLTSRSRAQKWVSSRALDLEALARTPAGWLVVLADSCYTADKSRALDWHSFDYAAGKPREVYWFACGDYDRLYPANLGRVVGAGQWNARRPVREPIVADVMLPPSEVPVCLPDTTLMEALEWVVQSGAQALPVCELSRVVGVVTLADLARHISDHLGVPSAAETVKALMRPATIVPADTPLSAIAQAIADDGIIVISGSDDRPVGYLTAESVLTQTPAGTSTRPATPDHPPLLIPGTGAVLLNRDR